jgi:dihydroorotase
MRTACLFILACLPARAQDYDLLLRGGHVIDPRNKISAPRDVAIKDGRIVDVAANIAASKAHKVVDVSGLYVTPGLLDIHVHVFAGNGSAYTGTNSVFPDGHTFRSGVTTVVDAGSSGWRNFPDFKERVIDISRTRVLAFLNIVGWGMAGDPIEQNTGDMDPHATAQQALHFKEHVAGVKTAHYAAPDWIAVDRAVEAGNLAGLPVMVDFGQFTGKRPFQDLVLKHLRPGDIYTHTYLAMVPMLDASGRVLPYLFEARKRGIIFDAGHGGGSFVFRQAVPAIRQGFVPDSISTDLHISSMNAGMKDMLNVMSKFLNMGLALDDVILRSTWNPAREIRREELGHLSPGAVADIAVLRVEKGSFGFVDVYGARMKGSQRLVAELTIKDGKVVWDLNGLTREDWDKLGQYNIQTGARWDGTLGAAVRQEK